MEAVAGNTAMSDDQHADLLPGTLDLMILTVLEGPPAHGYAVARAIKASSGNAFLIEEGSLYPALRRLEKHGLIKGDWKRSESNRRARYYTLTRDGAARLVEDTDRWRSSAAAVDRVLAAFGRPTMKGGAA